MSVLVGVAPTTDRLRVRPVPRAYRPTTTVCAQAWVPVPTLAERVLVCRIVEPRWTREVSAAATADALTVARGLCGPLVEVCVGVRSPSQVARWVSPHVLARLRQRARLAGVIPGGSGIPVVRRLITCDVGMAVEVAAAVDDSRRTRAVAMRLEPHHGLWRVTALEVA
ncbi:MAG: Rv3235 family protein [Micrococcales bacterium]|nr:Rv3235 family protein [Micrococcales bacterium]